MHPHPRHHRIWQIPKALSTPCPDNHWMHFLDPLQIQIFRVTIGQRRGFSTVDVHKINQLYGCTEKMITSVTGSLVDSHAKVTEPVSPSTVDHHATDVFVPPVIDHLRTEGGQHVVTSTSMHVLYCVWRSVIISDATGCIMH